MTKAGARWGYALVTGLLIAAGVPAQTPATRKSTTARLAEQPAAQQPKNQSSDSAKTQQPLEGIEPAAVVPPAPFVIRREESLISIPMTDSASSASSQVPLPKVEGVVVTLPKMEGIVSVPITISKAGQQPKYEARSATASSSPRYEARDATASSAPVKVGSVFGYRRDPFTRREKFHSGVDIKARWGDPVGASQPGTVQFAGWHNGYGNLVIVDHGGGVTTYYAHLSSFELAVGAKVERGTIVGFAGSTGRATSPHLHYEVRIDGSAINPFQQVALDPSSAYFKQSRPATDVSGPTPASPAKPNGQ